MNQDIRSLLWRAGAAELLARLGAAGARDVGLAEAEIQAGGVAVRGGEVGARPGRRVRPGRAGRAPQPDHGQPDRRQHLRNQPQLVAAYQMVKAARPRARIATPRRRCAWWCRPSPAPTRWWTAPASTCCPATWCSLRPGAGTAMPTRATKRATDRLPRRAVRAAFGGDVLRAQPGGFEKVTRNGPPHRTWRAKPWGRARQGRGDRQGALPTIGLHLLRLPSGTRRQLPKTTVNNLYSVIMARRASRSTAAWRKISRSAT